MPTIHQNVSHLKPMKIALWIHCLTHMFLAATLVFYFDHLHRHILHLATGKVYLPVVTHYAIHWRNLLWLVPVALAGVAIGISRRGLTTDRYAVFSACSLFILVSLIGITVLATCAPFLHPPIVDAA